MKEINEIKRLEIIAENSLYMDGMCPNVAMQYCFNIFFKFLKENDSILELGPAEGLMTDLFIKSGFDLTVVEGSEFFSLDLKKRYPNIEIYNCLFEDFITDKKFDNIILGHVLEHVEDPIFILKHISKFLKVGGKILAAVPNAKSLHRQAAVKMGLLNNENSLNALDLHHGHRRVFCPESFKNVFIESNLNIDLFGGYWLKPLSNKQIDESWNIDMLSAFMELGESYPEIAGEIFVVASQKG
ncbi:bifunctional 2-polyprenyl-6-hydroxyphenol methylase/3-demethylubiquinol 3-O-methyltransferase UbiG [Acinetobacter sp. SwsAc4]|uniref:class I SAM-dependent methyltransferase n=1 Tax=Acinetobacter sp. SwsAc4 TaxID=2749437 RepID=UPI0015BCB52E|nr:class I SAM-dependent methyltransferase [Acinetobacter sp. SwsAc4]NWK80880.1 class I SAM-dependent methyltransferase [Acinetobacter sp. SwsAc4]